MHRYTYPILVLLLSLQACKEAPAPTTKPGTSLNVNHVRLAPVAQASESGTITALGIITSATDAKPAFKTGGIIARTLVEEGDVVRKGQLLATLQLTEIEAQVQQAELGLAKAERDLARAKNLYQDSVATLETVQNATTGVDVACRTVEIARFNKQYSQIYAPISGKVVKQLQHAGEIVGPGMPVYVILATGQQDWKLQVGLADRDWARVQVGDDASVTMAAWPGQTFNARVTDKASIGNGASGTLDVELRFKNPPAKLAAGLSAQVQLQPRTNNAYTSIPIEALVTSNGSTGTVFIREGDVARRRTVRIARLLGATVAISGGLEGITEVITAGAAYLEDGDKIKVQ